MGRRGGRGGGRQPREAWGQRGQAGRRRGPAGEDTRHWRPHGTRRHGCPAPPGGRVWQGGWEGSTRTQDKRGREARPESRGAGSVGGGGHRRDPGAGCPSGAAVVGGPREPPGWPLERMAGDLPGTRGCVETPGDGSPDCVRRGRGAGCGRGCGAEPSTLQRGRALGNPSPPHCAPFSRLGAGLGRPVAHAQGGCGQCGRPAAELTDRELRGASHRWSREAAEGTK